MIKLVFSYLNPHKDGTVDRRPHQAALEVMKRTGPFPMHLDLRTKEVVCTIWGPRAIDAEKEVQKIARSRNLEFNIIEHPVFEHDLSVEERGYGMSSDVSKAPSYLIDRVVEPDPSGPSKLLADGRWCGHGEPLYRVYDVKAGRADTFKMFLPTQDESGHPSPITVKVSYSFFRRDFLIYDTRVHSASVFADPKDLVKDPLYQGAVQCPECWHTRFQLAVGFAISMDSTGPNDVGWFAVAAGCRHCGFVGTPFFDETS